MIVQCPVVLERALDREQHIFCKDADGTKTRRQYACSAVCAGTTCTLKVQRCRVHAPPEMAVVVSTKGEMEKLCHTDRYTQQQGIQKAGLENRQHGDDLAVPK